MEGQFVEEAVIDNGIANDIIVHHIKTTGHNKGHEKQGGDYIQFDNK
jgi:hypothetical protein